MLARPNVTSALVGAAKSERLKANLAVAEVALSEDALTTLDALSAPAITAIDFVRDATQDRVKGGTRLTRTLAQQHLSQ